MSAVENATVPVTTEVPVPTEDAHADTLVTAENVVPKVDAAEEPQAAAAAEEVAAPAEEKVVEPVTEGQLAYKGPGLVKSLIASKKEFWLNDAAVQPESLDLFLRGEKPEIAHPIAAWASQTGKGLLFFNKKGDVDHAHPSSILDLYNATDLKKESGHQFAFKLHGSAHTFKAANETERDGWYVSIEKAIELGKASQEEVQGSEAYKAELEKLNTATLPVAAAGATKARGQSQPKKSAEANRPNSANEEDADKKKKSRSTSRGLFGRRKANAEEAEAKPADKEPEEESKPEGTTDAEAAAVAATAAAVGATGVAATEAAPAEEKPIEAATETPETKTEEAPKLTKRGSIFGKLSGWGSVKSPTKEKDLKDAELKPESPAVETSAAETAPTVAEPAEAETALPTVGEPTAEAPKEEVVSPTKEKSKFLSGVFAKRGRSVSPSNIPKTEEAPAAEPVAAAEPVEAAEEPVAELAAPETADKPAEEAKTEATTANKRQSILGNLGRRASKAFRGIQTPKPEATAPEATKEETAVETAPVEVGGETKALEAEAAQNHIGDVVPEAISVGQTEQPSAPVVTASA